MLTIGDKSGPTRGPDGGNASGHSPLLARDLRFGYDGGSFLEVSRLELQRAEFVGLLGPNGAGKSTLLRILAGLERPSSGTVEISGQNLAALSIPARARRLAWVPQRSETPFDWSVREMVALGRYPFLRERLRDRPEDGVAVEAALARVGLAALADRPIATLSGGEWQRALVARALTQEPVALLLDEPVANLDLRYQRGIYELLRSISAERGVAVLVADHHLDLLAHFCDRLLMIDAGHIVAQGTPSEVLTEERLASVFQTAVRVEEVEGRPRVFWRFDSKTGRGE